ncbi:unnamed protein product [Closterium sp. NIES-64]|nr:unnamed protein product [Closterium sp. NIES-64]
MSEWQRLLGDGVDDDIIEDASRSQGSEQQSADISDGGGHPSVQQPATPVRRSGRGRGRPSMHGAARRLLVQGVPLLPYSQRDMEVAGRLSLVEASATRDACRPVATDTCHSTQ